ncbi:MAG: exo-alpha-sialidase [Anaerolineaceae bacterium]|nr:exo-alpha-sialidase [Anaerolineaceae bacterium]
MSKRIIIITIVLLGIITAFGALTAVAADPPVQASGASPFYAANCTADNDAGPQSGTNYANTEVEPWVDINPTNADNIVGAWQQDRWSSGGARGLVAGVSTDGGASWTQVVIPKITRCSGANDYQRASDPWVTFDPDGNVYHISLSFNDYNTTSAVLVNKSTNGGLNWEDPVTLLHDTATTVFNDKESITADPNNSDYVYAIWDRLVFPTEKARGRSPERALGYRGPIWFARTTDGGGSWEEARQIYDPGEVNQTLGNQIVVRPQGELINIFNLIYNFKNAHKVRGYNVAIIRSTDHGESWSSKATIIDKLQSVGVTIPDTGDPVRTGDIIPEIAVDHGDGNLYVVWQDARFSGGDYDEVAFSMSSNGGDTWSPTIRVNASHGKAAFTPSVRISSDGTVGVTYYAFADGAGLTDYYLITCSSGCDNASNWGNETRVTDTSFDMTQAPVARGFFTGDYEGLATHSTDFLTFFSQSHDDDGASIFFSRQ